MLEIKDVIRAIAESTTADGVKKVLSKFIVDEHAPSNNSGPVMGVEKINGVSLNRARKEANAKAMAILERVGTNATMLTEEDKAVLRQYSGIGGTDTESDTGGHIHEYYTPPEIAAGVWDGLRAMGFAGGNTLEPSAGAGVFQEMKPAGTLITAAEIDPTSSAINQLLHPEDAVFNQPFEKLAADAEDNLFDSCIGNVPFGAVRGATAALDPSPLSAEIKAIDAYFVARVIDKVRPGGLIGLVVPTGIISGSKNKKLRRIISQKAEFLGAHRLPSGVFSNSGTDVVTDILFMRKHPEELAELLPNLADSVLKKANVLWPTFINGKWFESAEGKRFVHGESETAAFQNRLVVNNTNNLTNAALKEKLSHKFESRIDWELIEASEPLPIVYAEGDEKLINGRWMKFVAGNWEPVKLVADDGSINAERYGANTYAGLESALSEPEGALSLTYDQLMAAYNDFPGLFTGPLKDFIKLTESIEPKYREQVIRGSIVGMRVQMLQAGADSDSTALAVARDLVTAEINRFGIPARTGKLAILTGRNANYWNIFATSVDKDGNFSDLLNGQVRKGETIAYDPTDATQTIGYLFSVRDLNPVPLDEFADIYQGQAKSLSELAKLPGVAITPDGNLAPIDRATSGNIVMSIQEIKNAMAVPGVAPDILDNYQRQLDLIEQKRTRTLVDSIDFNLTAKWLPREYIKEFLSENGYSQLTYSKIIEDEDGYQEEVKDYQGNDGIFGGYKGGFDGQLVKYLNGGGITSSRKELITEYKSKMRRLEEQFSKWLRQHDDIEAITDLYNDTFNGYLPVEHSNAPLELTGTSGEVVNFDYQCAEIRRLSENGGGICGFGTGLGKSFTALGLVAYNNQLGRARRTAIVVPKSVIDNWYHETRLFFGVNMSQVLFVGINPELDEDGNIKKEPVLDENGEQKINPKTGTPIFRDTVSIASTADVKKRLNMIPQSNYSIVVMTKEQFASIPMRPESVGDYTMRMVDRGLLTGKKYVANAKKHRDAMKNERFKQKYADTGTAKAQDVPYFEDMGFDNIIADEGHNYRNSYAAGRESAKLAYLPTAGTADIAVDMAQKADYIKSKFDGRGITLLSATPAVNSPTDIFNMLSLVVPPAEWQALGILDVDDFIKVFGQTEEVLVQKISGEVEQKTALVGFQNLSGLRAIFHKYVSLKTAKDVSATVEIPDLDESEIQCNMKPAQAELYEELRSRADELNKQDPEERRRALERGEKVDSVFSIIRDMDRVTTDLDLYNHTITFTFPEAYDETIKTLAELLPKTIKVKDVDENKTDEHSLGEAQTVNIDTTVSVKRDTSGAVVLVVSEYLEDDVLKLLKKLSVPESVINHPIYPKYARLLEALKTGLEDGKQIIFTDEKTQHRKIKRIIANNMGIEPSEIGILNADTASGGKRKKQGESSGFDQDPSSLDVIAADYNEGRYKILICNKTAEVGINLHIGTADIHHLTLPWTPASIKQRNGRGARVGSKQKKVRVHYYVGKGSFDEFRLGALKRKSEWMYELFNGDADRMGNADAEDAGQSALLLAKDPEERAARIAAAQKEALEKIRQAEVTRANIDLNNYLKASFDLHADPEQAKQDYLNKKANVERLESTLAKVSESAENYENYAKKAKEDGSHMRTYYEDEARGYRRQVKATKTALEAAKKDAKIAQRLTARLDKAHDMTRQLKPAVSDAIQKGLLDVPPMIIDQPEKFMLYNNRVYKVGALYNHTEFQKHSSNIRRILQVKSFNWDLKLATVEVRYTSYQYDSKKAGHTMDISIASLGNETNISETELSLRNWAMEKHTLAEIVEKIPEELFRTLLKEDAIAIDGGAISHYWLISNDGGFDVVSTGREKLSETFVYPDPNNTTLKQRVAKWLLENRKHTSDYSAPKPQLVALYGEKWLNAIESHGNTAPASEVTAWAAKAVNDWLAEDESKAKIAEYLDLKSHSLPNEYMLYRKASSLIPANYDNHQDFKDAMAQAWATKEAEFKQKRQAETERREKLFKAGRTANATATDEDRAKRMEWLLEAVNNSDNPSMIDRVMGADSVYLDVFGDYGALGAIFDDLTLLTDNHMPDYSMSWAKKGVISALTDLTNASNRAKYQSVIDKLRKAPEPEPQEQEKVAEVHTQAKTEITALESAQEFEGITVKLNSTVIMNRKVRVDIGTVYCIHDPKGLAGKLYENKEALKALSSGVFYKNDKRGNSECPGSWWFVPATNELNDILTAIEVSQ